MTSDRRYSTIFLAIPAESRKAWALKMPCSFGFIVRSFGSIRSGRQHSVLDYPPRDSTASSRDSTALAGHGREHLIRVRISGGPLHAIEPEVRAFVTVVARRRQRVVGRGEGGSVLFLDRLTKILERDRHHDRNRVFGSHGRVLERGV